MIFTEGKQNIAIVRALLPHDLSTAYSFQSKDGRSTIVSVVKTYLIKHQVSTAI